MFKGHANKDRFVDIRLSSETLDIYHIRVSIYRSLQSHLGKFHGTLLDIGCGQMPYREMILSRGQVNKYIGLDLENSQIHNTAKADLLWDGISMPIADNSVDCAFATEVLEHCYQPGILLSETLRVLKPNGVFFFTVPFLWPIHEVPFDEYRYTPYSLEKLLQRAGFHEIVITAPGGWHSSMAQMLGLWVRRSPLSTIKRKWLSILLMPVIKYLLKNHKDQVIDFQESQMLTSLHGISYKPK